MPLSIRSFGSSIPRYIVQPRANISRSLQYGVRTFTTSHSLRDVETKVSERFDLSGRSFVITGGGRGMGFGITRAIAQMGGNVAILDLLPEPEKEFNDFPSKYGVKTVYKNADVTKQDSLEGAFSEIVNELPNVNGLVTAAGIAIDKSIHEHGFEESKKLSEVNIMGTLWPVKLLADHLVKNNAGSGSIVMIASVAAHGIKVLNQQLAIYAMSKAAVKGLAGPMAAELGPRNIRINTISPGPIVTPMTEMLRQRDPKFHAVFRTASPLQGMGKPDEDIAPAVVYLLSDASKWVTAIDLPVTGGVHAGISVDLLKRGTDSL